MILWHFTQCSIIAKRLKGVMVILSGHLFLFLASIRDMYDLIPLEVDTLLCLCKHVIG